MKTKFAALLAFGATAIAATAGTLTDGNATLTLIGPPVFGSSVGDVTFRTDPNGVDQGFKYTWYYRTPNNNQNRVLSSLDTPIESFSGNTATVQYTSAGPLPVGFERFDADMTLTLQDSNQPGQALVCAEVIITNPNPNPVTYQFFNLVDLDLRGTPVDDTASVSDPNAILLRYEDGGSTTFAEVLGVGATAYQLDASFSLRSQLNGGAANLDNVATPFTGDAAVALQWTLTIDPGASATMVSKFAVNQSLANSGCGAACDVPGGDADIDGDCDVDLSDLAGLLANFGSGSATHSQGDTDFDGDVDLTDLANLLGAFGASCP